MLFKNFDIVTEAPKPNVIKAKAPKNSVDYGSIEDDPGDEGGDAIQAGDTGEGVDYTQEETDAEPDPNANPDDTADTTDATDYTEDNADDPNANPDDTGDQGDTTDYTQDQGDDPNADPNADMGDQGDPNADETSIEDKEKNYSLIGDFINLYKVLKENIDKISSIKKEDIFMSSIINQVVKNLAVLEDNMFQYIYAVFKSKTYVENLYQFNCFIEALKINIEMLKKIKDLQPLTK
jgi:hypothetical protein